MPQTFGVREVRWTGNIQKGLAEEVRSRGWIWLNVAPGEVQEVGGTLSGGLMNQRTERSGAMRKAAARPA